MGKTRALRAVAKKTEKHLTLIGRWSKKYSWIERVGQYEGYLDRLERVENDRLILEARARHRVIAAAALSKAAERLKTITPDEFTPSALASILKTASEMELQSLGAMVQRQEVEMSGPGGKPLAEPVIKVYFDDGAGDESEPENEQKVSIGRPANTESD